MSHRVSKQFWLSFSSLTFFVVVVVVVIVIGVGIWDRLIGATKDGFVDYFECFQPVLFGFFQ